MFSTNNILKFLHQDVVEQGVPGYLYKKGHILCDPHSVYVLVVVGENLVHHRLFACSPLLSFWIAVTNNLDLANLIIDCHHLLLGEDDIGCSNIFCDST